MTLAESPTALDRAIEKAGSQSALGRLIGKRQSVISDWLRFGRGVPAEFVLKIETATGVSRHDLRPDLYPREDGPALPPAPPGACGSFSGIREGARS